MHQNLLRPPCQNSRWQFSEDDYYDVLHRREVVAGNSAIGHRAQLLLDSDLEEELELDSDDSNTQHALFSLAARKGTYANPTRERYSSMAVRATGTLAWLVCMAACMQATPWRAALRYAMVHAGSHMQARVTGIYNKLKLVCMLKPHFFALITPQHLPT